MSILKDVCSKSASSSSDIKAGVDASSKDKISDNDEGSIKMIVAEGGDIELKRKI